MTDLMTLLRCPICGRGVTRVADGAALVCAACARSYLIHGGVPRFVPADNYAANFGLQWNRFARTQLDSQTGTEQTGRRFLNQSGWTERDLRGTLVLDAGCGSGRFSEIALDLGAEVVAIDYSSAVDACWRNLGERRGFHVVQADIYALPFAPSSFDFVFSFGVIQHTPDVQRTVAAVFARSRPAAGSRSTSTARAGRICFASSTGCVRSRSDPVGAAVAVGRTPRPATARGEPRGVADPTGRPAGSSRGAGREL